MKKYPFEATPEELATHLDGFVDTVFASSRVSPAEGSESGERTSRS
jgi:hypothetical protein